MRVAIINGNGHLDKQIERLLNQHGIKGDFVNHLQRNTVKQYDAIILSHRNDVPNKPIFIERLIIEQAIPIIYITNTPSIGQLYNVYHDLFFNLVNEITMEVELPVTIKLVAKYMKEIRRLQSVNDNTKERLETILLTNKAKRVLMNKGLSEEDSHQFIQKKAMDLRVSKRRLVNLIIENKIDI
ncbi:ANTAR domain-containing protein [Candidatus Xianfuyuplasma coldseepsis]|uniref:ANTAR domain-containing protein n=1 Tax=Candidatus Xianfuyuplasma coldseepsis TaxID=2782163 RepID=A0A7L7KT22_9MOLU|nr:ANTAR domain-containing protein [Xianfuyuplasma coldseepsis]QMS84918.1 ANTAR domain-containing protein [Xianfuyuplasma coldseepsis]